MLALADPEEGEEGPGVEKLRISLSKIRLKSFSFLNSGPPV